MQPSPRLHHASVRIAPQTLELVSEMFGLLGCKQVYREGTARWALFGQDGIHFDIQVIETHEQPRQSESRVNSHVAFISENPRQKIDEVEAWAASKKVRFARGAWSERELWLIFPMCSSTRSSR